jgi:hypothetical protein
MFRAAGPDMLPRFPRKSPNTLPRHPSECLNTLPYPYFGETSLVHLAAADAVVAANIFRQQIKCFLAVL